MAERLVHLGAVRALGGAARHHVTLRNVRSNEYHSVLLFAFAGDDASTRSYYCMEATCPHLGAPLEGASLETVQDEEQELEDMVVVCPWHQYDFSLRTGESATGLQSCVYGVHLRPGTDGEEHLFVDPPTGEADPREASHSAWQLVDVRAVSEGVSPATCRPADRRIRQAARCAGAQAGAGRGAGIAGRHVRPRGRAAAVAGAHHARRLGRARAQHAVARAQGGVYAACGACVCLLYTSPSPRDRG